LSWTNTLAYLPIRKFSKKVLQCISLAAIILASELTIFSYPTQIYGFTCMKVFRLLGEILKTPYDKLKYKFKINCMPGVKTLSITTF
jgi:hypothetical protein